MSSLGDLEAQYNRLVAEGLDEEADRLEPLINYLAREEPPDTLTLALELAGRGFAVFPAIGKQPDGHWPSIATTNIERVVAMWAGKGDRNIGISCKRSGLLVVDEDRSGGMVAAAAKMGQPVPETYSVATGKGRHYYFRAPDGSTLGNSPGGFAEFGCDIRGPGEPDSYGGYVIGAGSRHSSGVIYTEIDSAAEVEPLPDWIVDLIDRRVEVDEPITAPGSRSTFALPDVIAGPRSDSGGQRHSLIVGYSASLRAQSVPIDVAREAITAAWHRCEQPPTCLTRFTLAEAERILSDIYARYPAGPSTGSRRAPTSPQSDREVEGGTVTPGRRRLRLTRASEIAPRRVQWLWDGRLARRTLSLLAGPEGLGKSTLAYWLAARLTRGELDGEYLGTPRVVFVGATEDAWAEVIVPRLMAAGADLDLVHRVDVTDRDDLIEGLELPTDNEELADAAVEHGAVLLLLDPLISRLAPGLDSHKDGEVRKALEPLVAMLDATGLTALGLIHLNKSGMSGILDRVMASKAFTAVARSVHVVLPDPDDQTGRRRLFGTAKSNLGKTDLPTLRFVIDSFPVASDGGEIVTGRIEFLDDSTETIGEVLGRVGSDLDVGADTQEAIEWLADYLEAQPSALSADVKRDAGRAGISSRSLARARKRLRVQFWSEGFPRRTVWAAEDYVRPRPSVLTVPTVSTGSD